MADEPRTEYLAHDDGRWIEYTLDSFQQRALGPQEAGGLIIGRDPDCDIVIDDDGIEDFHVRLFGRGHHPNYIECIAGSAQRFETQLHPGDEMRGSGKFAGWSEAYWNPDEASPALSAALSIARDADLEGRHDDADAIRLEAGYRKIHVPWRREWPERLAHAQQIARVRVEEGDTSVVWAVGSLERMWEGITIGSATNNDVFVPSAGRNRIRIRGTGTIDVDVLDGSVLELGPYQSSERTASFRPYRRWQRFQLGEAVVQLCRWPKRGEALR